MKRKNISRYLVFFLVISIIGTMLIGCGGKDQESEPTDVEEQEPTENLEDDDEEPEESGEQDQANGNIEPGWKKDTSAITFDWYLHFSWFPNKWGVDATSQMVTEKTGVDINFIVPAGNEAEKLNTLIAANSLPDFITLGWWEPQISQMIEADMVYALNELADEHDPYFYEVAVPSRLNWYTQEDGNVYGYPNSSYAPEDYEKYDNLASNQTFLVRKDIYEAIGSPDMRTPEDFLDALKKAKEQFSEINGQPIIPIGLHEFGDDGNYSLQGYLQNFLAIPIEDEQGNLYDRESDPEYVRWLKVFREANEMGLISSDIFIDKRAQMEEKIQQGRYFSMLYQRTDMEAQNGVRYAEDPDSVYIAVDGPANSEMDPPTLEGPSIAGWTLTLISKNCKDPARAIQFMSYWMSEEGQQDLYLGPEGVTWEEIDGKKQFLPEVLELRDKDRTAFDQKYGADETFWMLMDNPMQTQWEPEPVEPVKQPLEWTYPYVVNMSALAGIDPTDPNSDEGLIAQEIDELRGQVLPQLILAESEEEFDKLWDKYLEDRENAGWNILHEFRNNKYQENKEKLGLK